MSPPLLSTYSMPTVYVHMNSFAFIPRPNQHHVIHEPVFSVHPNEVRGRNKHLLSMKGLWKTMRKALCPHDQMARTSHSIPSVWENNTQQAKEIPPAFISPFWFFLLNDFSRLSLGKKKKSLSTWLLHSELICQKELASQPFVRLSNGLRKLLLRLFFFFSWEFQARCGYHCWYNNLTHLSGVSLQRQLL